MRVYVAGPLTQGGHTHNIRKAILAATALLDAGHAPFLPHINYAWDMVTPRDYEVWMDLCLEWVGQCKALIRLLGHSYGSDREVALAISLGIPVYNSVEEFLADHPA